jgi:hypothetical protein
MDCKNPEPQGFGAEGTLGILFVPTTSLVDNAGRMSGVELREPRNLCVCVSKECGHGEGTCVDATLLTYTRRRVISLTENTDRMTGVELQKPRNLCLCVSEELVVSEK